MPSPLLGIPNFAIRRLRGRKNLLAGLLDAGFSSLATFGIGVYATRILDPVTLGGYALCYRAIFLVALLPTRLIFTPAEVSVVVLPTDQRLIQIYRSVCLGVLPAIVAAILVAGWSFFAPPEVPKGIIWPLTITGMATALLSPLQDHIRRMLHTGGRSWAATITSAVQLIIVTSILILTIRLDIHPAWVPFGTLALANLISSSAGLYLAHIGARKSSQSVLSFRELAGMGRWLIATGMIGPATAFAVSTVVGLLAGASALGYAEAARVVASPILVLGNGLSLVLNPKAVQAAQKRNRWRGRTLSYRYVSVVLIALMVALALFSTSWRWNPFGLLIPKAYVLPFLVAVYLLAEAAMIMTTLHRSQILGGRREASLTGIETLGNAARLAVAGIAGLLGAYTIPLGILTLSIVRWFAYQKVLKSIYAGLEKEV